MVPVLVYNCGNLGSTEVLLLAQAPAAEHRRGKPREPKPKSLQFDYNACFTAHRSRSAE